MWGQDENDMGMGEEQQPASNSNPTQLLKSLNVLNKIGKQFDDLYDNIVVNLNNYNLHSAAIQRIEVKDLTDSLNSMRTQSKTEEYEGLDSDVKKDIDHLLNNSNSNILSSLGIANIPSERRSRYETFEEIANVNYIAYRMLKVYVDNILIKNNQTKQFLTVSNNSFNESIIKNLDKNITNQYKNFTKMFISYFDIQKKLKDTLIPKMLKYGDCYLEVINLSHIDSIVEKNFGLIQESSINENKFGFINDSFEIPYQPNSKESMTFKFSYELNETSTIDILSESSNVFIENDEGKIKSNSLDQFKQLLKNKAAQEGLLENENFWELDDEDPKKDKNSFDFDLNDIADINFKNIQDIYLNVVEPHKVVTIAANGIVYGYIIIEDDEKADTTEIDIYQRFMNNDKGRAGKKDDNVKKVVEKISKGIINKLKTVMSEKSATKIQDLNLSEEVETSLKVILYHKIKDDSKLKFRFVSQNRLVHFHTNIDKYDNYGTSIYEPIVQPLKMYTIAMMSSIVSRLSRAAVVRRWIVEAGSKKNHPELIAKLKQDIASKSVSFESLSNIKNISNIITDYKDFATVSVNGQRYVDMEVVPMHDRGLPVNDMQDLRNELIAATGIPSVYLNINDQADVRETLVNLNIGFANNVSAYQDNIDDGVNKALNIVFNIILENNGYKNVNFTLSNYFKIALNPPVILMLQAAEASISSVANIIGMLNGIDFHIDPQKILEQYIPQIDWADLKKSGDNFIKKKGKEALMAPSDPMQQPSM